MAWTLATDICLRCISLEVKLEVGSIGIVGQNRWRRLILVLALLDRGRRFLPINNAVVTECGLRVGTNIPSHACWIVAQLHDQILGQISKWTYCDAAASQPRFKLNVWKMDTTDSPPSESSIVREEESVAAHAVCIASEYRGVLRSRRTQRPVPVLS
jgi:hypothetical protein